MNQFCSALLLFLLLILYFIWLQKRSNRTKTIEHLEAINDPIIKSFKNDELRPIKESSAYHSPDISETDEENPSKRKLITKDLTWRSTTVRLIDRYQSGFNYSDINWFLLYLAEDLFAWIYWPYIFRICKNSKKTYPNSFKWILR